MRRLLMLLATVVVAAGCSAAPVAGAASPSPATPSLDPAAINLPDRPRDLPLNGVDPCSLLTPAQRAEFGLDGLASPGNTSNALFAGRACDISGYEPREIDVGLTLALRNGIDDLIAGVRDELTPTTILDFPAVIARPPVKDACSVDIDVADGQFLDVALFDAGKNPPIPQDQLCADAIRIAEAALRTLQVL
jgi:hypothetical protein